MAFSQIENGVYRTNVQIRHARGTRMRTFFFSSLIVAIVALLALLFNIFNQSFGLVAVDFAVDPSTLSEQPLDELSEAELTAILEERASGRLLAMVYDNLSGLSEMRAMSGVPLSESIAGANIPEGWEERPINDLSSAERAQLLEINLSTDELVDLVYDEVVQTEVLRSWNLDESLLDRSGIEAWVEENEPGADLEWRSWVNMDFLTSRLSPTTPAETGILPALLGTIWLMFFTALIAFPLGVGAGIYLEEYATDAWYNKIIEVNIRNLAGVPSIIYGMLGLAIFVRALEDFTSGDIFGGGSANGRTVISGALTLSLLILPIIISGTQEALRAVPSAIREGSYGLGATKWQTTWRQVLPSAFPGILTGTILALSRAIGETAPIIVVGAATFLTVSPDGPFSQFTAIPRMIYHWTSQPNPQYQNAAAAAIIILLILLLTMNSIAVVLRNRASQGS